jgi:hypothetical protein
VAQNEAAQPQAISSRRDARVANGTSIGPDNAAFSPIQTHKGGML